MVQIPSVSHLKYDRFKQNIKPDNFMEKNLEALSPSINDSHYSSSIIILCCYLTETYEEGFISTAGDSGLTFSS